MRSWGDKYSDAEDGSVWSMFFHYGAVAGYVVQFPSNAPTTYAYAKGNRIGAFSTWDDAKAAVEKRVPFIR